MSATTALTGLSAFAGTAHAASNPTVDRQGGQDRFGTSALIAENQYPNGVPGGNVILATGYNYPDALAGAFLAGNLGAPVLLVPTSTSDPYYSETTAALAKLLPGSTKKVTILGGSAAVGNDVQSDLTSKGYTVSRIGGNTRYDTAQMIDTASGTTVGNGQSGNKTCIVANGENFPDALSGGPLAFAKHFPIVLTNGTQQTLNSQASATISADGCKNFIVLGGSAAVSQGIVTQLGTMGTVDKQVAGQDRSDTAAQLATYEISTYGFSATSDVILASGQTFPDALSSGPWGGNLKAAILLTELDGSLGQYSTAAFTKYGWSTIHIAGGTAAVSTSAQQQAVTADQAFTAPSNQTYTATAPSSAQTVPVSTGTAPTSGNVTYTFSNVGTSPVDIALFPCSGTNAPSSSSGTTTFTPPTTTSSSGTTTPTAGNASGQGTTANNKAFIESVNGVPTGANDNTNATRQYNSVTPTNGTVTFILNSFSPDCAVPVVFQQGPAGSANQNNLQVGANGQPTQPFGVGPSATWTATTAPAGTYSTVTVDSVNPTAGTFQGTPLGGTPLTFSYTGSGDTYTYKTTAAGTYNLSETQFASVLSGPTSSVAPNSGTTTAPQPSPVPGDVLGTIVYSPTAQSTFSYPTTGYDVPAAPASLTATYNAAQPATSNTAAVPQNIVLKWTAPPNPDVASYNVYRATQTTSGGTTTTGGYTLIGSSTTTSYTDSGSASAAPTGQTTGANDTAFTAGTTYSYVVTAVSDAANAAKEGPASNAATATTSSAPAVATPSITAASIISGTSVAGAYPAGTGEAVVTYNEAVTCLSAAGADFSYSNSGGSPHPIQGASCAQGTAGTAYNGSTTDNSANTLIVSFAPTTTTGTTTTQNTVAAPGTGDTLTYTEPATPTTANAVYATASSLSSPVYAPTQTVTDNGQATGNPLSNNTTPGGGNTVPHMVSAVHGMNNGVAAADDITVTYNENVNCSTAGTNGDWSGAALGGGTVTACTSAGTTTLVLTVSTATAAGALNYAQSAPTTTNAVYGGSNTAPLFAKSPDTVTAT